MTLAVLAGLWGYHAAAAVYRPELPPDHVARAARHAPVQLEGVVAGDLVAGAAPARLLLRSERLDDGGGWRAVRGLVQLTLRQVGRSWPAGERLRARIRLRRPRNFGNPGEFDYAGYLARRGVYVTAFAEDDGGFLDLGRSAPGVTDWLSRWRRGVGALFARTLAPAPASVLGALIIGTDTVPRELRAAFSRAGVAHVLSISGLHVGLVAGAGYALCRWLLARSQWLLLAANVPKLAVALSLLPVLLYAGIAGGNVATVRAVIMLLVLLGAVLVDRQRRVLVGLALAALVILLWSPGAARDISFQLSFVSVLGIVLGVQRFWPWWRAREAARLVRRHDWRTRLWGAAALYLAVAVSAQAATLPLAAFHFNQVSLVSLVANVIAVPLLGSGAVALGLLAALLYAVWEPAAQLCVALAGIAVRLGMSFVQLFAALPYASLRVVTPTLLEVGVLYGALGALVGLSGRARRASLVALSVLGLADAAWWGAARYHRTALRVTFLSVGQGDSAVVELPGSAVMVVDGGGLGGGSFDTGERVVAPFLWSRKIAHVDVLVLSHPDYDHYGGLGFLAAEFSPREFWSNGDAAASPSFAALQGALAAGGVHRRTLRRGDRLPLGAVEAAVFSPPRQPDGRGDNDRSLVFSLTYGAARVLFPGDIEARGEDALLGADAGALASAILKVPHHGSATSSTAPFLHAVQPRLAVVSAGFDNRFGFPSPKVVRRYAALPCTLARTDVDGAVAVDLDASGALSVERFGGPETAIAPAP